MLIHFLYIGLGLLIALLLFVVMLALLTIVNELDELLEMFRSWTQRKGE